MLVILIIFLCICLYKIKFNNGIDEDSLNRERTTAINGIFVVIVLLSHFNSYVNFTSHIDVLYLNIMYLIGQLMVSPFLFYSGYGIYESIKTKKDYINNFFKNRILKLFITFSLIIILYIIFNLIVGNNYSVSKILLSFIGYESIGNSNWYIFAIFYLYLTTLLCFKLFDKKNAVYFNLIFSAIYIILMMLLNKPDYYYSTIFCYNAGMFFSLYKDFILNYINNFKKYLIIFISILFIFVLTYYFHGNIIIYELSAIVFSLLIVMLTFKIKIQNSILEWLGKNTFNIYALQRISYMIVLKFNISNLYIFFILSIILLVIIVYIFNFINKKVLIYLYKR